MSLIDEVKNNLRELHAEEPEAFDLEVCLKYVDENNRALTKRLARESIENVADHVMYQAASVGSYALSDQQQKFIRKAQREGLEINYSYSGRGMHGRRCPAVRVDSMTEFSFKGSNYDNMGRGWVIYQAN